MLYVIVLCAANLLRSRAHPDMCIFLKVHAVKRMVTLEDHPTEPVALELWPPLDEESRLDIEDLEDSDMCIVYAPSRSFDIDDGPRQQVLYQLLRDEERTRQVRTLNCDHLLPTLVISIPIR